MYSMKCIACCDHLNFFLPCFCCICSYGCPTFVFMAVLHYSAYIPILWVRVVGIPIFFVLRLYGRVLPCGEGNDRIIVITFVSNGFKENKISEKRLYAPKEEYWRWKGWVQWRNEHEGGVSVIKRRPQDEKNVILVKVRGV
ncbi:Uncharacterized protein PKNOH_S090551603 [Plasmodium knowlesi]|uniref:Uncharacterized protein n=1 Tax=Plasmodium knowlesi TaxID=5850 RepID=A0A1Y3DST6_PLAKN|nr:Uncharacterized protein PKNOH_S090551603 [Plasmodium knowlesi]